MKRKALLLRRRQNVRIVASSYFAVIGLAFIANWGCNNPQPVEQSEEENFFPISVGLSWTYVNVTTSTDSFQIIVERDTVIQDKRYYSVAEGNDNKWMRWNRQQQLTIWDIASHRERVFLDFAIGTNDSSGEFGYVLASKTDTVSTFMGEFVGCYRFFSGLPFIFVERTYARSVGLVQMIRERGARQIKYAVKSYARQP